MNWVKHSVSSAYAAKFDVLVVWAAIRERLISEGPQPIGRRNMENASSASTFDLHISSTCRTIRTPNNQGCNMQDVKASFDALAQRAREELTNLGGVVPRTPITAEMVAERVRRSEELTGLSRVLGHEPTQSFFSVEDTLRRAGFFDVILRGDSLGPVLELVRRHAEPHTARVETYLLLDWFEMPHRSVSIDNHTRVAHLSATDLEALSSPYAPEEIVRERWATEYAFLCIAREENISPGSISIRFTDVALSFARELLPITLFSSSPIRVPVILTVERGWRTERLRFRVPELEERILPDGRSVEEPVSSLYLRDEDIPRFEAFAQALARSVGGLNERSLSAAARRFTRATLVTDPIGQPSDNDDRDDVLLQYIIMLEALFAEGRSHASIADKVSMRAALLAGDDDQDAHEIRELVGTAYAERSALVHGGSSGPSADVSALRRCCRRSLVAYIAARSVEARDALLRQLDQAIILAGKREEIRATVRPLLALCDRW